ncbi:MAG: SAM-dependent methyltransferase [Planctomycetota bacterium]|nr:MAG: SAM-dependent methyltransferase [Planctomycetota bacterium]
MRIIGGRFRGRKLKYEPFRVGDEPVTRPMKHRVREAIFNLISIGSEGRLAIDLFAGTGALGLEALSRGAAHAVFIERHVPTARVIEENVKSLGVDEQTTLLTTSAFVWAKRELPNAASGERNADGAALAPGSAFRLPLSAFPWLVFCSPPYAFFTDRRPEMLELISALTHYAPADSICVVEADEKFDFGQLSGRWDVRSYLPAVVGIWGSVAG